MNAPARVTHIPAGGARDGSRPLAGALAVALALAFALGCEGGESPITDPGVTDTTRFHSIERQLGGFSQTMWEVGYRYTELYWAGEDENWGYAAYQLDKIKAAIERGIERRPARAANSRPFLDETLPAVEKAIAAEDADRFAEAFESMRHHCNGCHAQEKVPFAAIVEPETRQSPVRGHR